MSTTETVKVVLLGEAGVGKTCIISQFISGIFDPDTISSLSAQFITKTLDYKKYDKSLKFEIWDTAGQEKYRAINKIFYQDAYVNILVYDITKKPTFDALKDYWYQEVKDNAPQDALIIIVGNKRDLYEIEAVEEDVVKQFCESVNALYKQTSAQTGEGVKELFEMIGKQILSSSLEDFKNNKGNSKSVKFKNDSVNIYSSVSTIDTNITKKKKCC